MRKLTNITIIILLILLTALLWVWIAKKVSGGAGPTEPIDRNLMRQMEIEQDKDLEIVNYGAILLTAKETTLLDRITKKSVITGTDYASQIKPDEYWTYLSLIEKLRKKAAVSQTDYYNNYLKKYQFNEVVRKLKVRAEAMPEE